jgi:tetratricopeptide (TPR) repeat protein
LPIAYVALSQALSRAGDLDAALAAAQQACRLSPNDAECFYILGAAQLQLGQIEPALGNLEQAMNRNPFPPAYLQPSMPPRCGQTGVSTKRSEWPKTAWPRHRTSGAAIRSGSSPW